MWRRQFLHSGFSLSFGVFFFSKGKRKANERKTTVKEIGRKDENKKQELSSSDYFLLKEKPKGNAAVLVHLFLSFPVFPSHGQFLSLFSPLFLYFSFQRK